MKQTKHILLTAATLLCVFAASAHDFEVDGIYYNITSSADLTVAVTYRGSSYSQYSNEYSGAITIPSTVTYNGTVYNVTSIGDDVFLGCDNPTSVTISEGVTSIGANAFRDCRLLTSVIIPKGVTSIGDDAFYYCTSLTSVAIPEGVTSIGDDAFAGCDSFTSLVIPASVIEIGRRAFEGENLTSIIVAAGNTKYDSREACNAIIETSSNTLIAGCSTTTIPQDVTSIGNGAFMLCSSLTSINIPENVTSIGDNAFDGCYSLSSISIPDSMTSIGRFAFSHCSTLSAIILPKGITKINEGTFSNCTNLTSITIPEGVASIEHDAFSDCRSLTSITIPEGVTSIEAAAFSGCESITSITIPASVTSIGRDAFCNCNNLTSITVTKGNTEYDSRNDCNAIIETNTNSLIKGCSSTIIPENITSLGEEAFENCRNLTSITIPDGVASIGDFTFHGCSSLTSITIPASVVSIGRWAFFFCTGFRFITSEAEVPPVIGGSNTFERIDDSIPVYVPAGSVDAYKNAQYWNKFTNIQPIIDNDDNNSDYIISTTFPDWISENQGQSGSISSETYTFDASEGNVLAFDWEVSSESSYDWFIATLNGSEIIKESGEVSGTYQHTFTSLGSNTLIVKYIKDGSVNNGDDQAKVYNMVLKTLSGPTIASGTCGDNLTWRLTEEYELVIEGTGEMYDYDYFGGNVPWNEYQETIQTITIGESVTSIGDYAFRGCRSLITIIIPKSVTSIGCGAFAHCSSLIAIAIPEGVTSIRCEAFYSCHNLTTITIPESVTSIEDAFAHCGSLISITIPKGVTSIGDAFRACSGIATITCKAVTPPTIAFFTFDDVDRFIPVYVPIGSVEAYKSAKYWSQFTNIIGVNMETGMSHSEIKTQNSELIYDLMGRRVTDTEGLKGVYIVNGKKVVIK